MLFPLYGRRDGVRLALGLHPLDASKLNLAQELQLFSSYASHTSYIGEVGLDFSAEGRATRHVQERVLDHVLKTPGVDQKVITLHSRGAAREVVDALTDIGARRAILHWYSGALRDLDSALSAGCYFSINPSMIRSAKGRKIISRIPTERALAETDGPYVKLGNKAAEPRDVWSVIDYLAERWNKDRAAAAGLLEANLLRLLKGL
jgi:TatD DNase family protein